MIDPAIIEEIRNKADIVSIISEYVPIKKRGKNYLGLCPFHSEKKPSFTVSPEKQLFHCFGCGEGGNIFAFLMKIENIDFVEAVEILGGKLGIEVKGGERLSKKERSEREKIYEVVRMATTFFQKNLPDKKAEEYLKQRNINLETAKAFMMGYALDNWDSLSKYLVGRGVHPSLIEKAGLTLKRDKDEGFYDRFRGRLIFPICNLRGAPVGFGGRVLGEDEPKYLNSPDSPIYSKGEILYGLNLSKEEIKKNKKAIIVEGYMDLITSFQSGTRAAVATLGTALTLNQAKLLQRFAKEVILAFDCDSAGGTATERSVELLRSLGLNVKVAELAEGKDPDEYIRIKGNAAFENTIKNAIPWMEYKIKRIAARYNVAEIEGRAAAIREVASILSREKDSIIQKEYINMAASLLKTDKDTISSEVKRLSYYKGASIRNRGLQRVTEKPTSKLIQAEKCLVKLALENEDALASLKKNLSPDEFTEGRLKEIVKSIISGESSSLKTLPHKVLETISEESKKILSRILLEDGPSEAKEKILSDCINTIKECRMKRELDNLRSEIQEEEKAGHLDKVKSLHKEFVDLSGILREFKKTA